MKRDVVTISREFGSGGRTIGHLLAEKLGYAFYDQELIVKVAKESGLAEKIVEQYDAQGKIITELADAGKCVIVGRGADYVLRGREDCLHAFIYADKDYRAERVLRLYGETDQKIEQRLRDKDERRKLYYRSFTMREWGDVHNYHIALDSGALGQERCVQILADLMNA